MNFPDRFIQNWKVRFDIPDQKKILLAVSGGIDSMAMAYLFYMHQIPFDIAHVNYKLRGKDSEKDAALVKKMAKQWNVKFHGYTPSIKQTKERTKGSTQEIARQLRYEWFDELCRKYDYAFVATAHQADDTIETFFINLIRGTGIEGLTGIPEINGNRIRPMLFAHRNDIEAFVSEYEIPYRIDHTNLETNYTRNIIRHDILPRFAEINTNFPPRMLKNMDNLRAAKTLYLMSVQRLKSELIHVDPELPGYKIAMLELAGRDIHASVLYELIKDFGFNQTQAADMIEAIGGKNGLVFSSPLFDCITDRGFFLIREKQTLTMDSFIITSVSKGNWMAFTWKATTIGKHKYIHHPSVAELDLEKLTFPLMFRKWEMGDYIRPLGMKGRKKISDLTTDHKLNKFEKDNLFVLCQADGTIIWVPGICISHQQRITETTQKIWLVQWIAM